MAQLASAIHTGLELWLKAANTTQNIKMTDAVQSTKNLFRWIIVLLVKLRIRD
jgi:hypothetical protein